MTSVRKDRVSCIVMYCNVNRQWDNLPGRTPTGQGSHRGGGDPRGTGGGRCALQVSGGGMMVVIMIIVSGVSVLRVRVMVMQGVRSVRPLRQQ